MKLRFSLRALLVLVATVAVFGYWRSRPVAIAREFELAIANEKYAAADRLLIDADDQIVARWATRAGKIAIELAIEPQSANDWLCGRLRGRYSATTNTLKRVGEFEATSEGMRLTAQREFSTVWISLPADL
jgi:hypothetical protein